MTDQEREVAATETTAGRIRQLILTVVLAVLLTAGLVFFVKYGGADKIATPSAVFRIFTIGVVVLGINYVSADVLMQLVMRMPLPSKLTGLVSK